MVGKHHVGRVAPGLGLSTRWQDPEHGPLRCDKSSVLVGGKTRRERAQKLSYLETGCPLIFQGSQLLIINRTDACPETF